jgi:hypothetical protein
VYMRGRACPLHELQEDVSLCLNELQEGVSLCLCVCLCLLEGRGGTARACSMSSTVTDRTESTSSAAPCSSTGSSAAAASSPSARQPLVVAPAAPAGGSSQPATTRRTASRTWAEGGGHTGPGSRSPAPIRSGDPCVAAESIPTTYRR